MDNTPKRKAASGKAANQDNAPSDDTTLLTKHLAVMFASTDRKLSGGDIAVLLQLMDYFNPRKGYAYPNMDTLAFNTNRKKRTIVDCIDRLENLGYLKIVRHGNRTTSNRYLPIFHEYVRPTKPDSDLDTTTVQSTAPYTVQSTATIGAVQGNELVQSTAPNTTYEPAQQAGEIGGGVAAAPPAAALPSPGGASQLASNLKYPEFWAVYPKRQNMSAANAEIASALARGVPMESMVAAARQYAIWIAAQPWQDKDKYTKGATNFIKQECWLNDYAVNPKEVKPKAGKVKATKAESRKLVYALHNAWWANEVMLKAHAEACDKCRKPTADYCEDIGLLNDEFIKGFCKVGRKLVREVSNNVQLWCDACDHHETEFGEYYEGDAPA